LRTQPREAWSPQPYSQVSAALRRSGHDAAARSIAIQREVDRRRRGGLTVLDKISNLFLGVTLGHGYRPVYAAVWSLVIIVAGWLYFAELDDRCAPQGAPPLVAAGYAKAGSCDFKPPKRDAPDFQPLAYSIDTFLPFDLKQTTAWTPSESGRSTAAAVEAGLGWVFAALLLAGLSGLLRRE
jgi:hypothetical protein